MAEGESKFHLGKRKAEEQSEDVTNEVVSQHEETTNSSTSLKTETPPHSVKVRYKSDRLDISVQLYRIPEQYIKLEPTSTHFYLDTLQWTKKYLLKFQYPQKIKVNPDAWTAELDRGVLRVSLPVVEILDKATGKMMRKKKQKISHSSDKGKNSQESPNVSAVAAGNHSNSKKHSKKSSSLSQSLISSRRVPTTSKSEATPSKTEASEVFTPINSPKANTSKSELSSPADNTALNMREGNNSASGDNISAAESEASSPASGNTPSLNKSENTSASTNVSKKNRKRKKKGRSNSVSISADKMETSGEESETTKPKEKKKKTSETEKGSEKGSEKRSEKGSEKGSEKRSEKGSEKGSEKRSEKEVEKNVEVEKSHTLQLIESVNKIEDEKRNLKLTKEKEKVAFFKQKEAIKNTKKELKEKRKEQVLSAIHHQAKAQEPMPPTSVSPKERKIQRRVSFSEVLDIKEYPAYPITPHKMNINHLIAIANKPKQKLKQTQKQQNQQKKTTKNNKKQNNKKRRASK